MSTRGILSASVVPDSHSISRLCLAFLGFLPVFLPLFFFAVTMPMMQRLVWTRTRKNLLLTSLEGEFQSTATPPLAPHYEAAQV